MQVLIVDDDDFALSVLENTITRMGYQAICVSDGQQALDTLRNSNIRLVITDWDMPTMNGLELCRAIRRDDLSGYVYIIMLTGREGSKQRMEGLCAGADDFLNKPLDPEELLVCLKTAERILALETRDLALFALAKLAESRDSDSGAHVERVQSYARLIAKNLSPEVKAVNSIDDEYIRLLYQTSPLHDLGKVAIPDAILLKPGKLTPTEFAIMETHTVVGAKTLDAALARFPNARFLQMAREIAVTHHERFDGSGYPNGLVGEQIPLCGRIVAVADVYDALTSRRVYKDAMSHAQALAIVLQGRGNHFDPEVVDAFLRAEQQVLAVWERLRDNPDGAVRSIEGQSIPAPESAGASLCTILVVDDDPIVREKLRELIGATGHNVLTAADGIEGLRFWQEHTPRVVISDWNMPGRDGVELCREIRARSLSLPVHFIMLTAHSDKGRLLDAYEAGINDFISKPFDFEELLARVRAGIRTAALQDELVRKAAGSQALNAQLATINSRLERLSVTDELTGLFNRRMAMVRLQEQWSLSERYGKPLTVAMIDIDHFKKVNDTFGHDAGDFILRQTAAILREQTRGTDVVCRVGGEEFLIIFPAQTVQEAAVAADRFRQKMESSSLMFNGNDLRVTVSIGLAMRGPHIPQFTDLLKVADQALYSAKNSGRNRTCRPEEPPAPQAQQEEEAISMPAIPTPSDPSARPPIDTAAVLKRCGNDTKFAAALIQRFRTQAAGEFAKLEAAVSTGNADTAGRIAHSLKSMAAYVSADAPTELARKIEDAAHRNALAEVPPLLAKLREEIAVATKWIEQNTRTAA
ncbi:MAG TPA: response regulator [Tepidisphaeraceae bacterium]|jgi:putative two-component system response regulator|nr:response regulator [Tepidisphaeraceae bacterium]